MNHADYGRYLSQQRELRGLSREEVASRTKLALSVIAALEEGQSARLPSRIFVLNYIRAYAQVIGLSAEEAVLRYEEVDLGQTMPSPITLERTRRKRAWIILLGVFLVCALVAAFAYFVIGPERLFPGERSVPAAPGRERPGSVP